MLGYVAEIRDGVVLAVAPVGALNPFPDPVDPAAVQPGDLVRVSCADNIRPGDLWGADGFAAPASPAEPEAV